jgi:phospholipase/carboxylesterase
MSRKLVKRIALLTVAVALIAATSVLIWIRTGAVSAIVRGGDGPISLVLLHGYGSRAEDWLQFEHVIDAPGNGKLVFLQGPMRGPLSGSRGWWWLNIEGHIPEGHKHPDFSTANPVGLSVASRLVRNYLDRLDGPIVLGGFSQGAMLSADIAFQTDQRLAGLVLLGGTTVREAAWMERVSTRRQLPVFIAHGRWDGVLPFTTAERFAGRLQAAGLNVTWFPFDGGHDIPRVVVTALNEFLATLPNSQR